MAKLEDRSVYFEAKLWLSLLCCADRAVSCSQLFRCPRFSFSSAGFKCSVQPWLLVAFFLSLSLALILSCLTLTTRQSAAVVFLGSRSWTHRFPEYRSLIDPSTVGLLIRCPLGRLQPHRYFAAVPARLLGAAPSTGGPRKPGTKITRDKIVRM